MNTPVLPPTPATRALTWCVHLLFAGLLVLAATRAVADGRPHAGGVVAVVAVCAAVYAAGSLLPGVRSSRKAAAWWLACVGAVWLVLLALSPDGVWLAFPLYFLQLHLLPRRTGLVAVAATAVAAISGYAVHQGSFNAAMAIGPALGAAVAVAVVWGYQALYRESEQRRRLIEELTAARADLAAAQHAAGVSAERERLAREIHDTLAQGLSSIQLLLRAAERALPGSPESAVRHVVQARLAAVDNLAEARRFVAALAPPSLDGTNLAGALERLCASTAAREGISARFHVAGDTTPLPTAHEVALLRVAQSAMANTVRHAGATTVAMTLRFEDGGVALDITDDGVGFEPDRLPEPDPETGGFGLAGMRARLRALGGTLGIASAPGKGTAVEARLPVPADGAEPGRPGSTPSSAPGRGSRTDSGPGTRPGSAHDARTNPEARS
ncbi:sensor histidine kinase [Streptomyces sp. NPDC050418]|uniref:sensor histidine kinase n=1 Tax=Streptomyces sp. NPDC050418 TaxID=3365612 RepID=UPI0037A5A789